MSPRIAMIRHYAPDGQESMRRYADGLAATFGEAGWGVDAHEPSVVWGKWGGPPAARKWMGYLDKFALFGRSLRSKTSRADLICLPDHSHGIYLHELSDRPHVVHVHDLMAIESARGEIPEHQTGFTGRIFQRAISSGLAKAKQIVCVSATTAERFRTIFPDSAARIEVIPNSLNYDYHPVEAEVIQSTQASLGLPASRYLLHVGGGSWYKNRPGVIELFGAIGRGSTDLRLVMVGPEPDPELTRRITEEKLEGRVHFLQGVANENLRALYAGAELLLFPSLMEGFGWPIVEAQACGTTVVTTNIAPMTEVGGDAAVYLPKAPMDPAGRTRWVQEARPLLAGLLAESPEDMAERRKRNLTNAERFRPEPLRAKIIDFYREVLEETSASVHA